LLSILIGLAILASTAIVVVLVRSRQQGYVDDSTPAGVVHNYILALQLDDVQRAYSYLADMDHKPSLSEFRRLDAYSHDLSRSASVRLGETYIDDDEAMVELVVLQLQPGTFLFNEISEWDEVALLVHQDGNWHLKQMPYQFWIHDWYREERVPIPAYPR
jgi:hypothetical protein